MTLCPVALAVGCIKCPVFKICPVKGIIGDYKKRRRAASGLKEEAVNAGCSFLPIAPTFAMSAYRKSSPPT